MYEFYLCENKHTMKNSWYELTQGEYISVISMLSKYRKAEMTLFDLRVHLALIMCGIDIKRLKIIGNADQFNENIYHLTRHLDFFFRIEYEDKRAFEALSPESRKQLSGSFPEDIEQTPEVRVAAKLKKHIVLNIEFGKNLVPEVKYGRRCFTGYRFDLIDNIAQTTLTAMQFSEAQKIVAQYNKSESSQLLDLICAILYQDGYDEKTAIENSKCFHSIEFRVKEAILYNFMAITNFIVHQTKYSILFDRPKKSSKKASKYSMGLAENIYSLSKRGYGDSLQMENANLFKFFDILVKELADQIAELRATGKKLAEIADKMNLTIEQVNELS